MMAAVTNLQRHKESSTCMECDVVVRILCVCYFLAVGVHYQTINFLFLRMAFVDYMGYEQFLRFLILH